MTSVATSATATNSASVANSAAPGAPAVATAVSARTSAPPSPALLRPDPPRRRLVPAGTTVPGAPNCTLFPPSNVWNTDISRMPVNKHSAAWLASMDAAHTDLHPDFGPDPGGYPYGIPFKIVTSRHPTVTIKFQYAAQSSRGRYPFGPDIPIEGGAQAGGDRHAIMVNKTTCTLYELWNARYSAKGSTAGSGAIWKLTSNALRPRGWTSADAAGLPILPGLLDFTQVQAATRNHRQILHAIRFTAQRTQSAFLWPARHEAGSSSNPSLPPMGARFRLKASFAVDRFCSQKASRYCYDARTILVEMQHYGMILADNGSNWFFQGSAFPAWPDGLIALLKRIPASSFQAIDEGCLRVSANSGQAQAKPGCPTG